MYLPEYEPHRYTNEQGFTVLETSSPDVTNAPALARSSTPPEPAFGDVGQGYRGTPERPFDPARLGEHDYYLDHKQDLTDYLTNELGITTNL